jgi:hypothetical protein
MGAFRVGPVYFLYGIQQQGGGVANFSAASIREFIFGKDTAFGLEFMTFIRYNQGGLGQY